jgi:hypothetical protein
MRAVGAAAEPEESVAPAVAAAPEAAVVSEAAKAPEGVVFCVMQGLPGDIWQKKAAGAAP